MTVDCETEETADRAESILNRSGGDAEETAGAKVRRAAATGSIDDIDIDRRDK